MKRGRKMAFGVAVAGLGYAARKWRSRRRQDHDEARVRDRMPEQQEGPVEGFATGGGELKKSPDETA